MCMLCFVCFISCVNSIAGARMFSISTNNPCVTSHNSFSDLNTIAPSSYLDCESYWYTAGLIGRVMSHVAFRAKVVSVIITVNQRPWEAVRWHNLAFLFVYLLFFFKLNNNGPHFSILGKLFECSGKPKPKNNFFFFFWLRFSWYPCVFREKLIYIYI